MLWIDDKLDEIDVSIQYLRSRQCLVEAVSTGAGGLELARRDRFDVIILDYKMDDMSGIDVLQHLRNEGNWTPVIVLTGYGTVEIALEAGRLDVVEFHAKPMPGADLFECVRRSAGLFVKPPAGQPLFRPHGTGSAPKSLEHALRFVQKANREVGVGVSPATAAALIAQCQRLLAVALVDPDLSFLEFAVCGQALHALLRSDLTSQRARLAGARDRVEGSTRPGLPTVEASVSRVVSRIEGAGTRWGSVGEDDLVAELDVDRTTLWRRLTDYAGLTFPQCRRAVVMRRAAIELATSEEQVGSPIQEAEVLKAIAR